MRDVSPTGPKTGYITRNSRRTASSLANYDCTRLHQCELGPVENQDST